MTQVSSWKHQFSSWYNPDIFLFSGFTIYLSMDHYVKFPPNPFWYCSIIITVLFMTMLVSSLLLVAMTFDRFYSIIRPHKAASFNTIRRTRIVIICTVLFSIVFNIPHLFVSDNEGFQCTPFGRANTQVYGKFFYWFSSIVGFALPFVLLLSMNSVIIHRLRTRSVVTQKEVQESGKSGKGSDTQFFIMLLLVTFGFLVLVTPAYILFLYVIIVDYLASPKEFARYYLFHNFAQKFRISNHGVNFLFYVISGEKFRSDLRKLLPFWKAIRDQGSHNTDFNSHTHTDRTHSTYRG